MTSACPLARSSAAPSLATFLPAPGNWPDCSARKSSAQGCLDDAAEGDELLLATWRADELQRRGRAPPGRPRPCCASTVPDAIFLGERRGEELAAIYASLDVFVHSGPYETFGQTLQEAAASGLPVVAPAAGGPLDLVADGVTRYLVPLSDPGAFTTAVARLAADPAARAAFGAAGRRSVLSRSWPALTEELIGHYAAVLGARGGQGPGSMRIVRLANFVAPRWAACVPR